MFGVFDFSVYFVLFEEIDDGLVVEVEFGVDILGECLVVIFIGYFIVIVFVD